MASGQWVVASPIDHISYTLYDRDVFDVSNVADRSIFLVDLPGVGLPYTALILGGS